MLSSSPMYTSVAVPDLEAARGFYADRLGLSIVNDASPNMIMFGAGAGTRVMVYPKPDSSPAAFTVLNFGVEDIEAAVADLAARGVSMEQLDGTNADGIASRGPVKVAWLRDPAGNWIGLSQGI